MRILLDSNILLRLSEPTHVQHSTAADAVRAYAVAGDRPVLVPQVLYEYWMVTTRPAAQNGRELTASEAHAEMMQFLGLYPLLEDEPVLFQNWFDLVHRHQVLGKNAHDARLVAAMMTHGLTHLLTFNSSDFRRFTDITVVTPPPRAAV
jgi:predicted nucleic acid-binding protein